MSAGAGSGASASAVSGGINGAGVIIHSIDKSGKDLILVGIGGSNISDYVIDFKDGSTNFFLLGNKYSTDSNDMNLESFLSADGTDHGKTIAVAMFDSRALELTRLLNDTTSDLSRKVDAVEKTKGKKIYRTRVQYSTIQYGDITNRKKPKQTGWFTKFLVKTETSGWGVPKGGVESTDGGDLIKTAVREFNEEIYGNNLTISDLNISESFNSVNKADTYKIFYKLENDVDILKKMLTPQYHSELFDVKLMLFSDYKKNKNTFNNLSKYAIDYFAGLKTFKGGSTKKTRRCIKRTRKTYHL
jgi:hypothetical protein